MVQVLTSLLADGTIKDFAIFRSTPLDNLMSKLAL